MTKTRMIGQGAVLVCVLALAGGVLAACGGDDSTADATADACASIETLGTSIVALESLDPTSATVDDYEAARDDVKDDLQAVGDSLEDVEEARAEDWQQARTDLEDAVDGVGDDTIAEALPAIQPQIQALRTATADLTGNLGCVAAAVTSTG